MINRSLLISLLFLALRLTVGAATQVQVQANGQLGAYPSDWKVGSVLQVRCTSDERHKVIPMFSVTNANGVEEAKSVSSLSFAFNLSKGVSSFSGLDWFRDEQIRFLGEQAQYKRFSTGAHQLTIWLVDAETAQIVGEKSTISFKVLAPQLASAVSPKDGLRIPINRFDVMKFEWDASVSGEFVLIETELSANRVMALSEVKPLIRKRVNGSQLTLDQEMISLLKEGKSYVWGIRNLDEKGNPIGGYDGILNAHSFLVISPQVNAPTVCPALKVLALPFNTVPGCCFTLSMTNPDPISVYSITFSLPTGVTASFGPFNVIANNATTLTSNVNPDGVTQYSSITYATSPEFVQNRSYTFTRLMCINNSTNIPGFYLRYSARTANGTCTDSIWVQCGTYSCDGFFKIVTTSPDAPTAVNLGSDQYELSATINSTFPIRRVRAEVVYAAKQLSGNCSTQPTVMPITAISSGNNEIVNGANAVQTFRGNVVVSPSIYNTTNVDYTDILYNAWNVDVTTGNRLSMMLQLPAALPCGANPICKETDIIGIRIVVTDGNCTTCSQVVEFKIARRCTTMVGPQQFAPQNGTQIQLPTQK